MSEQPTSGPRLPRSRNWLPRQFVVDARWNRLIADIAALTAVLIVNMPTRYRVAFIAVIAIDFTVGMVTEFMWTRDDRVPIIVINASEGLICATVLSYVNPEWAIISMFAYLMSVAYAASAAGRRYAIAGSCAAFALVVIRQLTIDPSLRLDWLTITVFGVGLVTVTMFMDTLNIARLRSVDKFERLYNAMGTVTASPGLEATLDSVVAAASAAVGALTTGLVLKTDDGTFVVSAIHGFETWPTSAPNRYARVDVRRTGPSPLSTVVDTVAPVVITDVSTDDRFPRWARTFRPMFVAFDANSMVSVPLRVGNDVIGVMETVFRGKVPEGEDTVRLLEAYAEQAVLVIVRAQAYERERQARVGLLEADALKSDFLALVTHELRTPLTSAKGFVDTVLYQWDRLDDDQRRALLTRALANADELDRLIAQLLDYSRIERAHLVLDVKPGSLAAAVERVTFAHEATLERHRRNVRVPPDVMVLVDGDAFGHVLGNLLTNAAKFSPPDTTITVSATEEEGEALLMVADEGPGIALDDHDRIFERFYQLPVHRATTHGTGLGLAIAQRYVEAMGGRIWVESEPGTGATFVVAFPMAAAVREAGLTPAPATAKLDRAV